MAFACGNLPSVLVLVLGSWLFCSSMGKSRSLDRVQGSMDIWRVPYFMSANGPEWIIPHLLILALLGGLSLVRAGQFLSLEVVWRYTRDGFVGFCTASINRFSPFPRLGDLGSEIAAA